MRRRQHQWSIEEPYASRFGCLLHFHDLAAAEASLRELDAARRTCIEAADHKAVRALHHLVLEGKQLAARLAASPRVSEAKRLEKREIALWFRVWLEAPELFFDWLALRKNSAEFAELFARNEDEPRKPSSRREDDL